MNDNAQKEGVVMSHKRVKAFLDSVGLGERHVVWERLSDTVENAAKAVGCEPAQIVKTTP